MNFKVHLQPAKEHQTAYLHIWSPLMKKDIEGSRNPDGTFLFDFEDPGLLDAKNVFFKYRFSHGDENWEEDKWIRRINYSSPSMLWTWEFSPRCTIVDPAGPLPNNVTFHLISKKSFADGYLYIWDPITGNNRQIHCKRYEPVSSTSDFELPIEPWLKDGFHFKFRNKDNDKWFEPDEANRVWRPGDGNELWVKSGQLEPRSSPIALVTLPLKMVHPKQIAPRLTVEDFVDDYVESFASLQTESIDDIFSVSTFALKVYPGGMYEIWENEFENNGLKRRPFVGDEEPAELVTILGDVRLLDRVSRRSVTVNLIIHPNPQSGFGDSINVDIGTGHWKENDERLKFETVTAQKTRQGYWKATFDIFPFIDNWFSLRGQDGSIESRCDGPFNRYRMIRKDDDGVIEIHTADGMAGVCTSSGPAFEEPPDRKALMRAMFSGSIVDAGTFEPWEMPHGAIICNGRVWFTLKTPDAVKVDLLLLRSGPGEPRVIEKVPMKSTNDLRYWWCKVPLAKVAAGQLYRFLLNGDFEVIDPAAREYHDPGSEQNNRSLWPENGDGFEGPWAKVVDVEALRRLHDGSGWRTMGWEALTIYELHAARYTNRNNARTGFGQIQKELVDNGHLRRLPVTALELLPVNEFSKDCNWGYSASTIFAVESTYGGPAGLAGLIRTCHDNGRALFLDLVYNHMDCSAMQQVAPDVYCKGDTPWGAMVHYGHPSAFEIFRQSFIYLWDTFHLDGFRLDATAAIINGHIAGGDNGGNVRIAGDCGWNFLLNLSGSLHKASDAKGQPWPYICGECAPMNWGACDNSSTHVYNGQWHFEHHYRLVDAIKNEGNDFSAIIRDQMNFPHIWNKPFFEAVRFKESHDSTSEQESWKKRTVKHEKWGNGYKMTKASAPAVLLSKGIPMLFMGEELGETRPFTFGFKLSDPSAYLNIDIVNTDVQRSNILRWYTDLLGLRNDPASGIRGDNDQYVATANKTIAFSRGWGKYFVIVAFGTPDTQQRLSWLGLPEGCYKEVLNSSWHPYSVEGEPEVLNGGYDAWLNGDSDINLPSIGSVILEKRYYYSGN